MQFQEAENLFFELSVKHGLNPEWRLSINKRARSVGLCVYKEKQIELSSHYLEQATPDSIKDTLLHEIAHALLPHDVAHGWEWQQLHRSMGGNGLRCATERIKVPPKYLVSCPQGCFKDSPAFKTHDGKICRKCKSKVISQRIFMGDLFLLA